jgi:hypothetical protein
MPSASSVTLIMPCASLSSNVCLVRELIPTFTSFVCSRFAWSTLSQWGTIGRLTNFVGKILCFRSCTITHLACTFQAAAWPKMTAPQSLVATMHWYYLYLLKVIALRIQKWDMQQHSRKVLIVLWSYIFEYGTADIMSRILRSVL